MRRAALLIGAGAISEGIYLALTVRLPWWQYGGTLTSWHSVIGDGWTGLGLCLAGIVVLLSAYGVGWLAVRNGEGKRIVWAFNGLFAVTLIWLMPITSDLFTYLSQAHLVTDLRVNPFLAGSIGPSAPAGADPVLMSYPALYGSRPSVYGPAWVLLSLPATAGRYDLAWGALYLKSLAALSYLGCAWLLGRIIERGRARGVWPVGLGKRPAALEAVYLFAWNPLVLWLGVGDGHNDLVMMAAVLLAIYWLLDERWLLALAALTIGAWVKYVAAALLPLALVYAWRCRFQAYRGLQITACRAVAGSAAVVLGTSALVLLPFGRPDWLLGLAGRLLQPVNSVGFWLGVMAWAGRVGLGLFVLAYLAILVAFIRQPGHDTAILFERLVEVGFITVLLAFTLDAARAQPWYLIWPASLAGLSTSRIRIGQGRLSWAWPAVAGLSAVLLAAQVWIEWGLPGVGQ